MINPKIRTSKNKRKRELSRFRLLVKYRRNKHNDKLMMTTVFATYNFDLNLLLFIFLNLEVTVMLSANEIMPKIIKITSKGVVQE